MAGPRKQYFRRKKVCRFCVEKIDDIDYKDVRLLNAFISERGKITPRRMGWPTATSRSFENNLRRGTVCDLQGRRHFFRHCQERQGFRSIRRHHHHRGAGIRGFADARHQRNFPQEGGADFFRRLARTAMPENMVFVTAIGTDKDAHILDYAQNRHLGLVEHGDAFAGVDQGYVLRRGDDHRAFERRALGDGRPPQRASGLGARYARSRSIHCSRSGLLSKLEMSA